MMDTEWKHSRVAWAPPYHPTERWWRLAGGLTLHVHADGYSDAKGNRVVAGDHHTNPPVLAMVWAIEDFKRGTWISRGRLLVRDHQSLSAALEAAKTAAEAAATIYTGEVA